MLKKIFFSKIYKVNYVPNRAKLRAFENKKHSEKNSLLVPHSRLTSILFKPNGNMPLHYTFLST